MEASASASSNEAIDQILLKKIQTILEKQSSGESEIEILRKEIAEADNRAQVKQQLGIVNYFSLFPQCYVFDDAERLIHLWVAEGFCDSLEDGRRWLSRLVGSSILQDVKKDEFGQVRSCTMHPLMHIIAKSAENITNPRGINVDPSTVQRASFYSSNSQVPDELYSKAKQLRSIFFINNTVELQEGKLDGILEKIFKKFKKLHVLDLRNLGIKSVPSSIGDLKDLEYLDLSMNKMKKLPSSIAKLSNLHTLKLLGCSDLEELPKDFKNLGELKHLDIEGCRRLTGMPRKMSKLSSLQTLSAFVASKKETMGGLEELAKLKELRGNLEILHLDRVQSSSFENMEKKFLLEKHLQRLTLRWNPEGDKEGANHHLPLLESLRPHSELRSLILVGFQGPSLPDWFTSLKSLVKLRLQDCHEFTYLLKQDDQLPNLKILELVNLKHLKYITQKCNKEAAFYESLEEMTIRDCPILERWENETEVRHWPLFAKLSKLNVHDCRHLQTIPLYPRLEEMVLHRCTLELLRLNTMSISLKKLHIQYCSDLTNLSGVFQHLRLLECLTIENCDTISLGGESKAWEGLKSLRFLTLKGFSKLSSLSFGDGVTTLKELTLEKCHSLTSISDIGTLTSLQELTLRSCGGLTSISDSIGQVTSLRSLEISNCNKLESLPKTIFKSLQTLRILDCKLLQPMFVKDTGDYWSLIGDIIDLQVKTTLLG